MSNMELKPCPFCGGTGTLHSIDMCKTVYAVCMKCGVRTVDYTYAEEAIKAWENGVRTVTEPSTEDLHRIPIETMSFSVRAYNCLKRAGIHTLQDLSK